MFANRNQQSTNYENNKKQRKSTKYQQRNQQESTDTKNYQ